MLDRAGNMSFVRSEVERRNPYRREELAITRAAIEDLKLLAIIVPGAAAHWHVVVPSNFKTATTHLVRRRFGIYLPMLTVKKPRRGRLLDCKEQLFPGYLFVFVWGIENQWRRIAGCPGVARIVMDGARPAILSDSAINELQWKEAVNDVQATRRQRFRKKWQRGAQSQPDWLPNVSTKSYWTDIEGLDGPERIGLLHKALGLPL